MSQRLNLATRALGGLALRVPLGIFLVIAGGTKLFTYKAATERAGDQPTVGLAGFIEAYDWLLPPDPQASTSSRPPGERRALDEIARAVGTQPPTSTPADGNLSEPARGPSWLPYSVAHTLLTAVPFIEFFGGLLILVGLLTRVAAMLVTLSLGVMLALTAGLLTSHPDVPFEPRFVLPFMAFALAMFGAGPLSLDWLAWRWQRRRPKQVERLPARVKQ